MINNTVVVSANEIDLVPGDNTAIEQTTILPLADLALEKTGSPEPVHAGELLTYRLNVTNLGPSAAADVHLMDDLPAEVASISVQPACGYSAGIVDCTLGSLAPSATIPVAITVRVNTSATGTITNLASVSTNTAESDLVNNQAQVVSTLLPPDLVPPVVSWITPVGDEGQLTVGCQVVHLAVNATDNVAIYRVRFYRWDHGINNYVDIGYDYSAPYQWELDTCNLPLGWNQIFAAAQDTSGNPVDWSNRKRILLRRNYYIFLPTEMQNNN